nr:MAG TPA: hypothetical protein [Bacteriophage sp.]
MAISTLSPHGRNFSTSCIQGGLMLISTYIGCVIYILYK